MNITPNEISEIEEIGTMNGLPVKLLTTKGGFRIAVGRNQGKQVDEALAAGSHPAIVKYNLEKQYAAFQPAMMKSEVSMSPAVVVNHSHFLSEDLKKSGHDVYSVQSGTNIEFQITKHDIRVGSIQTTLEKDSLVVNKMDMSKEFSHALAGATTEKALSCGAAKVRIQGK
ncbi:MAG: hypothetical protein HC840_00220 [Leptolyngbyaceae cyanobacterium RM2_2_4]|nr:hypothetical protein [Leptolyngbyaceae cyanobacterium RM2_2_4]